MMVPSGRWTHIGCHPQKKVLFFFFFLWLLDAEHDADGQKTAYFRGRKLHGTTLKVPEGYRGVVVEKQEASKSQAAGPDGADIIDVDAEDDVPLGALETQAEFEEMIVWGHESIAEASSDPYVRGVDEWMKLAEQVRINFVRTRIRTAHPFSVGC